MSNEIVGSFDVVVLGSVAASSILRRSSERLLALSETGGAVGAKGFCSLAQANACAEHERLSAIRSTSLPLFVLQRCVALASQSPLIVH